MTTAPATAKGHATRERIIAAAADLVAERGVRGTSLDHVRTVAGVSKSQLYHYFADKAALMRAVVGCTTDRVLAAQRPQLDRLDSWDRIGQWFDALVALQERRQAHGGCPIGSLVPQFAEHDEQARAELARSFDDWQDHLTRGLSAMQQRGELTAGADPATLANATMASIEGGLLLTQTRRDPRQLRIALDAALTALRVHRSQLET